MRSLLLPLLLAAPFAVSLVAQGQPAPVRLLPLRPSPAATLSQEIGISRIEISFSRPGVKGRKIWVGWCPTAKCGGPAPMPRRSSPSAMRPRSLANLCLLAATGSLPFPARRHGR